MESSPNSESSNNPSAEDHAGVSQRRKKKVRKKRDPLNDQVRKSRKRREDATIKRQKVERIMLAIAGVVIVIFLINIILVMTSEVNLNWLTWIVISVGIIGLIVWSILKLNESLSIRKYQKFRALQRKRDKDLG